MIKIVDKERNFQLSVESNLGLLWFCFALLCFALLCDCIRKLVRLSEPIRFKLKLNLDLVNHDFLRLSRCPYFCGRFFALIGYCDSGFGFTIGNLIALQQIIK